MTLRKSCLKVWRGLNCVLTVDPTIGYAEIVALAVPKLRVIQPDLPDGEYCLLYSNNQLADKVPPSGEPFTLAAYKAFIGKPYQKLSLFICPVEDYDDGVLLFYFL